MKYYLCKEKGLVSSDECFACFSQQAIGSINKEASRVLCKRACIDSPACFGSKFESCARGCSDKVKRICETLFLESQVVLEVPAEIEQVMVEPEQKAAEPIKERVRKDSEGSGERQGIILGMLKESTGLSMQDIAEGLSIKVSTCWNVVNVMLKSGLIIREEQQAVKGKKIQYVYRSKP